MTQGGQITPKSASDQIPIGNQHVQAYKDATDNLIFLKREQLQITYYTWLLLASLYILAQQASGILRTVLLGGCFVVAGLSVWMLWDLHSSMGAFRARLRHIYETYFHPEEREPLRLSAEDHRGFVLSLTLICVIAGLFTACMIFTLPAR